MIQKERNGSTNSIYIVYLSLPRLFKKAERQINVAITDGVHVCLSTPGLPEEETPAKKVWNMKHTMNIMRSAVCWRIWRTRHHRNWWFPLPGPNHTRGSPGVGQEPKWGWTCSCTSGIWILCRHAMLSSNGNWVHAATQSPWDIGNIWIHYRSKCSMTLRKLLLVLEAQQVRRFV